MKLHTILNVLTAIIILAGMVLAVKYPFEPIRILCSFMSGMFLCLFIIQPFKNNLK